MLYTERLLVRIAGITWLIEEPFISDRDEVVRVDRLDVCRNFRDPVCDRGSFACSARSSMAKSHQEVEPIRVSSRNVPSTARAPWLIGQLPGQNRGFIRISAYEGFDVILERCL